MMESLFLTLFQNLNISNSSLTLGWFEQMEFLIDFMLTTISLSNKKKTD